MRAVEEELEDFAHGHIELVASDPVAWSATVLGLEMWPGQAEFVRAVANSQRVAVRAGHKVGKTTGCAALALWWVTTKPAGTRVILTSATYLQLRDQLWREIVRLYRQAKARGWALGAEKVSDTPEAGVKWPDGREILGFATDTGERAAGWSGANMLFICDEASGIDDAVFEALEGNRASGDTHQLLTGNPTLCSGTFYEVFRKGNGWMRLQLSSLAAADWQEQNGRRVPGLAAKSWVDEKRDEWWPDPKRPPAPEWKVRVEGEFPEGVVDNRVLSPADVARAVEAWRGAAAAGPLEIGVDVARDGADDTAIVAVRGLCAIEVLRLHGYDTVEVKDRVLDVARRLRKPGEVPRVKIDSIGLGSGAFDLLLREEEVIAVAVKASQKATVEPGVGGAEGFHRLRDQLWWGLRGWIKAGGAIPPDERLQKELCAPIYWFVATGLIQVESKDDLKKKLERSPDSADALALAVYVPPRRGGIRIDYEPWTD